MDKDKIRKAISQVKLEDEAYHELIIEYLTHEDDDYSSSWKGDAVGFAAVTDSSDSGKITFNTPVTESDLDKKPAARKEPIKDTPTLKTPITGSYLGKILSQSESGPTDMSPVVTEPLTLTENPFNPEPLTLTENPVVTELDFIGQGGPWAISGGTHTQSIIQGGENIICSDVITHVLTNPDQVSLECDSFAFNPLKAQTLIVAPLDEPFLASNGNVRSESIIGASRPDQSRIIAPGMNEDISSRDNVRNIVRSDVGEAD